MFLLKVVIVGIFFIFDDRKKADTIIVTVAQEGDTGAREKLILEYQLYYQKNSIEKCCEPRSNK